ncbi:hypothetical protein MKW98_007571 [Papaver atlanticum]|uniref:Sucrose-phosphatase n=1 Tax=Papaver atlanticum TaxID=357466 RepID=A0AAD4SKI8_9MAGN|nr:hypothetical protein MKW98_007571 [Papaver atlanticum]
MLISDLDLTMVDHQCDEDNISQLSFNALWESHYHHDSLLVFSTGRTLAVYKRLKKDKPMLTPDITIIHTKTYDPNANLLFLNENWDKGIIMEETDKFPELSCQSEADQRQYKVSFFVDNDKADGVIKALSERLQKHWVTATYKIVFSGGKALDVLPKRGGKGEAITKLGPISEGFSLGKFGHGKQPCNTLVCGDSGNDAELFGVPDVFGVMVGNAMEELLQWREENAKNNPNIIHTTERCAAGIIQAIGHFKLGPNLSPRDVLDFSKTGLEVVKFYIFYEQWRRAEIADPERHIENLKEIFYPSGVFVSLSSQEHPLHDCLGQLTKFYGNRQGKQFRVWVDHVTSTQIGSETWSMKFDKWEFSDDGPKGRTSTVSTSDGFVWMHMHQTLLTGFGATDQTYLLF